MDLFGLKYEGDPVSPGGARKVIGVDFGMTQSPAAAEAKSKKPPKEAETTTGAAREHAPPSESKAESAFSDSKPNPTRTESKGEHAGFEE